MSASDLTLEKLRIDERLKSVEKTISNLDTSVQDINGVLFGNKGAEGVVSKLNNLIKIAQSVASTMVWIARLIGGAIILAALPSITNFINMVTHIK